MTLVPRSPDIRQEDLNTGRAKVALMRWFQEMTFAARNMSFLDQAGTIATDSKPHNFDGIWVVYVSNGTADTEDTVAHGLGRIPVGILTGISDKSAVVYDSGTAWTSTNVFLKASATTVTTNVLLF